MKTKELIELLQKADPSGELHIHGVQGIDRMPAYYDGSLIYYKEGKWVISDKGSKIVLKEFDRYSLFEDDCEWEEYIIFDCSDDRENDFRKRMKEIVNKLTAIGFFDNT